ncbi:MAG: nitroreductase [Desulfobacterales bacterium]|nr:nitroreductase [Desulfobacterales bacterium]
MEFNELVKARRSCRSFADEAVSDEEVNAILEAGQWAPSPLNLQPWQFVVVREPAVKARIRQAGETAKQAVADGDGPSWAQKYAMDFVEGAPALAVVLYDPAKGGLGAFFNQPHGALQAASACIQNMMLKAADLGLESLWFTFYDPAALAPILRVPDNLDIAGVIALGKPSAPAKIPPRKPAAVHQEHYES